MSTQTVPARRQALAWLAALTVLPILARAQTAPGQPAPDFRLKDLDGRDFALADLRGKYVVLEWNNPHCPFVKKHYGSGNLPGLQKRYTAQGVAWLLVNSTAAAHPEHMDARELAAWLGQQGARPTALLLDEAGRVGRAYGAKTTPQMVVIDPHGALIYHGAIDDRRGTDPAELAGARNYVAQALDEARSGKPVSTPSTPPYGCSVKYL